MPDLRLICYCRYGKRNYGQCDEMQCDMTRMRTGRGVLRIKAVAFLRIAGLRAVRFRRRLQRGYTEQVEKKDQQNDLSEQACHAAIVFSRCHRRPGLLAAPSRAVRGIDVRARQAPAERALVEARQDSAVLGGALAGAVRPDGIEFVLQLS